MQIEIIENIEGFVHEETGNITLKITPKKFDIISNEESGQIVLNEIMTILGFAPIKLLDDCLIDHDFIKENNL